HRRRAQLRAWSRPLPDGPVRAASACPIGRISVILPNTTPMTTSDGLRALNLQWKPVAIGFVSTPPSRMPRVDHSLPAGCAYWKYASEGRSFYTTPEDHFNCPVGAFTHGVTLPETQKLELEGLVSTMIKLEYLQGDEVASIPHRHEPLKIAVYAPLH